MRSSMRHPVKFCVPTDYSTPLGSPNMAREVHIRDLRRLLTRLTTTGSAVAGVVLTLWFLSL